MTKRSEAFAQWGSDNISNDALKQVARDLETTIETLTALGDFDAAVSALQHQFARAKAIIHTRCRIEPPPATERPIDLTLTPAHCH